MNVHISTPRISVIPLNDFGQGNVVQEDDYVVLGRHVFRNNVAAHVRRAVLPSQT